MALEFTSGGNCNQEAACLSGSVIAIGNFDGVHAGHQDVLREAKKQAEAMGLPFIAMFFDPHPSEIIHKERLKKVLTLRSEREALLKQLGAEPACVVFDKTIAAMSAEHFCNVALIQWLNMKFLVIGENFRFGYKRQGDPAEVARLAKVFNFGVSYVGLKRDSSGIVSSSRIRTLVEQGDMEKVTQLLGRPFQVSGKVVRGDGRGSHLGIPTANLEISERKQLPKPGVYASRTLIEGEWYESVTNVGSLPTFKVDAPVRVETNVFTFEGGLYDKKLTVQFVSRLRDEMKFASPEALVKQIKLDQDQAKKLFK